MLIAVHGKLHISLSCWLQKLRGWSLLLFSFGILGVVYVELGESSSVTLHM